MSETQTLDKVRALVAPIVGDLQLDLYDLEFRGGTLRVAGDRATLPVPNSSFARSHQEDDP